MKEEFDRMSTNIPERTLPDANLQSLKRQIVNFAPLIVLMVKEVAEAKKHVEIMTVRTRKSRKQR